MYSHKSIRRGMATTCLVGLLAVMCSASRAAEPEQDTVAADIREDEIDTALFPDEDYYSAAKALVDVVSESPYDSFDEWLLGELEDVAENTVDVLVDFVGWVFGKKEKPITYSEAHLASIEEGSHLINEDNYIFCFGNYSPVGYGDIRGVCVLLSKDGSVTYTTLTGEQYMRAQISNRIPPGSDVVFTLRIFDRAGNQLETIPVGSVDRACSWPNGLPFEEHKQYNGLTPLDYTTIWGGVLDIRFPDRVHGGC